MKMEIVYIKPDEIEIPIERKDAGNVEALKASIQDNGQLHPIIITPQKVLIAGRRRLQAMTELGKEEIAAVVMDVDADHRSLIEIDENLIRGAYTALELGDVFLARKEVYERLHPDSRAGVKGGLARAANAKSALAISFTEDTALQTGQSVRTIQEAVQIAKSLSPDVKIALRDTWVENEKTLLLWLARLGDAQGRAAELLVSSQKKISFASAKAMLAIEAAPRDLRSAPPLLGEHSVICGDCHEIANSLPAGSFDLVLLEQPSKKISSEWYSQFSATCSLLLRPGGVLIFVGNQACLFDSLTLATESLVYQWTLAMYYEPGLGLVRAKAVASYWKPILIFSNGAADRREVFSDIIKVDGIDGKLANISRKSNLPESVYFNLIEVFSRPGDKVLDICVSTGASALAALKLGRSFVGIASDEGRANQALSILEQYEESQKNLNVHDSIGQEAGAIPVLMPGAYAVEEMGQT